MPRKGQHVFYFFAIIPLKCSNDYGIKSIWAFERGYYIEVKCKLLWIDVAVPTVNVMLSTNRFSCWCLFVTTDDVNKKSSPNI